MTNQITIINPIIKIYSNFISAKVIIKSFFEHLANYEELNVLEVPFEELIENENIDYDYIYMPITRLIPFILRSFGIINSPFLIHFHCINGQLLDISRIIPFLHKDDVIIVPSIFAKKAFHKIAPNIEVHVIPNSIDVVKIKGSKEGLNTSSEKKICYMGRLIENKGIEELIDVMSQLVSKLPNVKLKIIGPKSGNYDDSIKCDFVNRLEEKIIGYNLMDHVDFTGVLIGNLKYKAMSECDLFVNPSTFDGETFGVVNIEAMACELPVVASNWSAFNEIIEQGKNGFIIDVKELGINHYSICKESLLKNILDYFLDENRQLEMKKNAAVSSENYHFTNVIPSLIKLLRKNCNQKFKNWDEISNKSIEHFKELYSPKWYSYIEQSKIESNPYTNIMSNVNVINKREFFVALIKVLQNTNYMNKLSNNTYIDIANMLTGIRQFEINEKKINLSLKHNMDKYIWS